jgi:hypothetical protein
MAMENVKRVCVGGLGAVKDGHGGLDQGTEGQRTNHGRLALSDDDKQMYMWRQCKRC